ncbi:universal stress protein [Smaragdicoccus niigatensis]|uniref:universal stress protein n=1 Tax=Smaragdicoccus niigatensis TaxID=359359 RepID=UPI00036A6D4A|nr:universal stress protein [Smaragdicoccus niigatensis]
MNSKPIVVGVDQTPSSEAAVRWAAADAARHGVGLLLVNMLPTADIYGPGLSFPPIDFRLARSEAQDLLQSATKLAQESAADFGGVEVTTKVLSGPATGALITQSKDARLVVVGSRGLSAFGRGLLGSVSSALPQHAHCPVAVVHERPERDDVPVKGRVVVGVDGTPNSVPAIEIAFDEASTRGADLVAVYAWSDVNGGVPFGIDWSEIKTSAEAVLAESLAGWADRYPDVAVHRVVVIDRPTRRLFEESEKADLIVVGSHGRGGFAGMMLGSTSRALLHSVDCPIIIARSPM